MGIFEGFWKEWRKISGTITLEDCIVIKGKIIPSRGVGVRLNGKVMDMVFEANEQEGWVKKYKTNEKGEVVWGMHEAVVEVLRGDVSFFVSENG